MNLKGPWKLQLLVAEKISGAAVRGVNIVWVTKEYCFVNF